jgi:hypothetical protein
MAAKKPPKKKPGNPKIDADVLHLLQTVALRTLRGDEDAPPTLGLLPNGEPDGLYETRNQEFWLTPYHVRAARRLLAKLGKQS